MLWAFFVLVLMAVAGSWLYLEYHPATGARPTAHHQSPHYRQGKFFNLETTTINDSFRAVLRLLYEYCYARHLQPDRPVPVVSSARIPYSDDTPRLIWYGHSAVCLKINGLTILIDPMLSDWVGPLPLLGHRFRSTHPFDLSAIGKIDLMLITHDHFDHLDYPTIKALQSRTRFYLTPLGVGAHLRYWGIDPDKIQELDWWQQVERPDGLRITATPARHFSGRSLGRRRSTLWASFVIETGDHRYYCGGDSGYGKHFRQIGERFGSFDLTMLDCAQYHHDWQHLHMQPEEAWQAHRELGGRRLLPLHWGAFSLSTHPWYEPIERLLSVADAPGEILLPGIGECIALDTRADFQPGAWWRACLPADR